MYCLSWAFVPQISMFCIRGLPVHRFVGLGGSLSRDVLSMKFLTVVSIMATTCLTKLIPVGSCRVVTDKEQLVRLLP